jgi:hypothetical protein
MNQPPKEVLPERTYDMTMFAEHYQFYLFDESADPGEQTIYWDEDSRNAMMLVTDKLIGVGTVRHLDVPIRVDIYPEEPAEENLDIWDHVTECSIEIPTGKLVISGPTEDYYAAQKLEVEPGVYAVRLCYGSLAEVDAEGFEGDDFYRIALWKSDSPPPPRILKQWDERFKYMY